MSSVPRSLHSREGRASGTVLRDAGILKAKINFALLRPVGAWNGRQFFVFHSPVGWGVPVEAAPGRSWNGSRGTRVLLLKKPVYFLFIRILVIKIDSLDLTSHFFGLYIYKFPEICAEIHSCGE